MTGSGGTKRAGLFTGGDMADRVRAFDWGATPLGTIETWSDRLTGGVEAMLAAPQLASLAVGPDRIFLYNDEAARHYGARHPLALGLPLAEAFPHEFDQVAAFYDRVFAGESLHVPAQPLDPARTGSVEIFDAYLTPIRENDGGVIAAHMAGVAVGARHRAEARLRESEARQTLLLRLGDALRTIDDPAEIRRTAMRLTGEHLGLARIYYFDVEAEPDGGWAHVIERGYQRDPAQIEFVGSHSLRHFGSWMFDGFDRGEPVAVSDIESLPGLTEAQRASYRAVGVAAFVNVPLLRGGAYAAGIGAHDIAPRAWGEAEIGLIREVAARVWTASERATAEAALRGSEARLALALKTLPLGVAVIDTDGAIVTANEQMRRFLPTGRIPSRDPERGARWRAWDADGRIVPPEEYPGIGALRGAGVSAPGMQMLYRDDGGVEIWTEVLSAPLRDEAGRINGAIIVVIDVDRVKRSEEAAQASEERLRQFGEASQDVLWIRDAETLQWVYLTPAFETVYGLTRDEALTGDDYRNWQDLIVPEDRDQAVASIARVAAGERVAFEYRIRRPIDGAIRWMRDTDFPITDEAGKVALIGGIGRDFTEVRDAELRFQTLVEGMPQLVWRAVGDGDWTWASPQWTDYTGQRDADYRGRRWLAALHADDRDAAREAWSHAMDQGGFEVEYRIRRDEDGTCRWFQTRAAAVRDHAGRIIEWLGTSTDIHDLRALQGRQRVLVAELQHRTRNLIGVVRSMADKTARGSKDLPDFRGGFRDRLEALARVQGLLSRLDDHDRVTFDELIDTELTAMDGQAEQVTLDGPAGVRLRSSAVQTLAMALHELATNALKYGALSQPDARLAISWRLEPEGADRQPWLHIDWRETGVRMPPRDAGPQGGGQGRELIERALPYQLSARTTYVLGGGGVHCTIALPISTAA